MKKLFSVAFLLMMSISGYSAVTTNKINNVDALYGQTAHSTIKLFNADLVVTNGNVINRIAAFNASGVLIGTNAAPAASEAAALTNIANLFLAPFAQTFNGVTTTSNLVVRGVVAQTLSTTGTSNTWAASSNVFSGMVFITGALKAQGSATHEIGSLGISGVTLGNTSSSAMMDLYGGGNNNTGVRITNRGLTVTNYVAISNTLFVGQSTTLGTNGSAIVFHKTATASLDYGNILAAGTADLTITVGGAVANDSVVLGRPSDEDASLATRAFVSGANTVTVRANNVGTIAVDQASKTYRVDVIHY